MLKISDGGDRVDKKALIISHSQQSADSLGELLKSEKYTQISTTDNSEKAKKLVENEDYDLICINAPLAEENGIELSSFLADNTQSCVVILVPKNKEDSVNEYLSKYGVLVIGKPINKSVFHRCIQFAHGFRQRMFRVNEENKKLRLMVEDMKIISRAKFLLISCLNMSEEQAHRYIEKQAMDLRTSKMQIAKQVIRTYQNQF